MENNFFIDEKDFRVWLPEVQFIQKAADEAYNARQICGVMSTSRKDRQGENVLAKGLDFSDFMTHGHFNDNHSQETSAIVGFPEHIDFKSDLVEVDKSLAGIEGWVCRGYVLKGTKRAEGIWELAKALQSTPDKRLGFSIEGKVLRRQNKTIEKARIRNIAITNCPVNTDAKWEILTKSFFDEETAIKAMAAGYGVSPATQTGGGALRAESLESKAVKPIEDRKKKHDEALKRALSFDGMMKAMEFVLEKRPDFDEEAAALFVTHLYKKWGKL